jgi:DNA polymerase (family 10)
VLDALANPYVDILAHPTNRLIGSRASLECDFERIVGAALETGVA